MKAEILKELQETNVLSDFSKHPAWKKAFEYYWQQTGDYNLKMGCTTCYRKVLEWLKN